MATRRPQRTVHQLLLYILRKTAHDQCPKLSADDRTVLFTHMERLTHLRELLVELLGD